MSKILGVRIVVDKDGKVERLLAISTDLVGPDAQVSDEDRFRDLVDETVKVLKQEKYADLDGAIYSPAPEASSRFKKIVRS